jgi:hypothetical protein
MSNNEKYSNTYLQTNNDEHDIENNMEETQVPEFTLYYVTELDKNYRRHLPDTTEIKYPWHIYDLNECKLDNLISIFELNELFTEHIDNISQLTDYVRRYESIHDNVTKIEIYYQEIEPIIQNDKANLEEIKTILHSVD